MAKTNNLTDFLTSLATKLRSKLGISNKINPQDFENKIDDVYNAGKQAEYDAFWDSFQANGTRAYYQFAFADSEYSIFWSKGFDPKYTIRIQPQIGSKEMFNGFGYAGTMPIDFVNFMQEHNITFYCTIHTELPSPDYIPLSTNTFYKTKITHLPKLYVYTGSSYSLAENYSLVTIDELRFSENVSYTNYMFNGDSNLTNVVFTGVVNSALSLTDATKLTHDSIISLINALKDLSQTRKKTLSLGKTNLAKLSDEEKAIATAKNWTLL